MKTFVLTLFALTVGLYELSAQTPPPRTDGTLRIVSYNVHNCIGTDGKRRYERIVDVIDRSAPDVIALQELDSMTIRHRRDVLGELSRRTGLHATYAPAIRIGNGRYGIGLLSREVPLTVRRIPLPGAEERRMLLVAEFERYVVLCTHFSLTEADRMASAGIILDAVRGIDKPLFLAGDMNDTPGSPMQRLLTEGPFDPARTTGIPGRFTILNNPDLPTYKSVCIDFIYGFDNGALWEVVDRGVIPEPVASDHHPVWVDVRLIER